MDSNTTQIPEPKEIGHDIGQMENERFKEYLESRSPEEQSAALHKLTGMMRAHASRVLYNHLREGRKDLVDEAVNRGLLNLHKFRGASLFTTWFHKIVANLAVDTIRQRVQRSEVPLEEASHQETEDKVNAVLMLQHIMKTLRDDERLILRMKMDGLTESEIALKMGGWQTQAVGIRWMRLKAKIRRDFPNAFY